MKTGNLLDTLNIMISKDKKHDNKCLLCGKRIGVLEKGLYFERGFSTKHVLCHICNTHKTNLLNFDTKIEDIENSKKYMKEHAVGKVSEIQNIVNEWIAGEKESYFPKMKDLMYYVEGPEAYLLVFKDRAVILSTYLFAGTSVYDLLPMSAAVAVLPMVSKTVINNLSFNADDAVMLFPSVSNRSMGFVQFTKDCEDLYKLNFKSEPNQKYWTASEGVGDVIKWIEEKLLPKEMKGEIIYTIKETPNGISLEKAVNGYGILRVRYDVPSPLNAEGKMFSFKFFYSQNRLMEEIYNYILRQANHAGGMELGQDIVQKPDKEKSEEDNKSSFSLAEELGKLKSLLDCGVINQEEFEETKKRLINKV